MPYPSLLHPEPLPLQQSTSDPYLLRRHSQFCLSLCGVPRTWCTQGLFEPSERLWREWGLILNVNPSLLPSCWGFSFALERGISHSRSSACRLTGVSLTLDMGCISSQPLLLTLDVGYLHFIYYVFINN